MAEDPLIQIYHRLKKGFEDLSVEGIREREPEFFRSPAIRRVFRRLGAATEGGTVEETVEGINRAVARTAAGTGDPEAVVRAVFRRHASRQGSCRETPRCSACPVSDLCRHSARRPTIKQLPKSERPRERLLGGGEDRLSDAELLGIIIGGGTPEDTAVDLARKLLVRFGGFRALSAKTVAELRGLRGIGNAKAAQIKAALAIARRFASEPLPEGEKLRGSHDLFTYFHERLRDLKKETFWAVMLDQKHRVLRAEKISEGTLSQSLVHPREVFSVAIRESAASVVFVHNHPSGDPSPSRDDLEITRRLKEVGDLVGIKVLDHLIVGADRYISLTDRGLL